jgi:hypothetical protein
MERLWRERGRNRLLIALLLAALAPGLLWGSLGLALRRQLRDPLYRATCRAGDVWLREPMPELAWIERHAAAEEPIFVFPFRNGTYFLTHTRSATSFPYLQHREGFHTEAQIRQAVEELERARPRIGILKGFRGVRGPYPPLAPLFAAIERSYEGYRLPNGVWVLRHRDVDRPSPPPDADAGEASTVLSKGEISPPTPARP